MHLSVSLMCFKAKKLTKKKNKVKGFRKCSETRKKTTNHLPFSLYICMVRRRPPCKEFTVKRHKRKKTRRKAKKNVDSRGRKRTYQRKRAAAASRFLCVCNVKCVRQVVRAKRQRNKNKTKQTHENETIRRQHMSEQDCVRSKMYSKIISHSLSCFISF